MFILRRITSENKECNIIIGESYNIILKAINDEEFKEVLRLNHLRESDPDIVGFVIYGAGSNIELLFKKSQYFMMTSDGNTFDNISKRLN